MAENSYATAADVRSRWPSLPTSQDAQVDQLCADASLRLRARYPGIDDQVQADADIAARAQLVVVNMVKRALMMATPGASQESSSTGPYSHSVTYANPFQNIFISGDDDELIRGYQPAALSMPYGC